MFSRKRRLGLPALACAAALLGTLVVASPGLASTAQLTGTGPDYTADPGEANRLTVEVSSVVLGGKPFGPPRTAIEFADPGATIMPVWGLLAPACGHAPTPERVWCALANASSSITADLGDQDDYFSMRVSGRSTEVSAGAGEDNVFGGPESDTLRGGSDIDDIGGHGGNDFLFGDGGWDMVDGGPGSDVLSGGADSDHAMYDLKLAPVVVTLDSVANDGTAGEGDNVLVDVEGVVGSKFGDVLIGSSSDNALAGYDGDDWLVGYGGSDRLSGEWGSDFVDGGAGDDVIPAKDGEQDAIYCGSDVDVVYADTFDLIDGDCETVLFDRAY